MKLICANDTRFSQEFAAGSNLPIQKITTKDVPRLKEEGYTVVLTGLGRLKIIMALEKYNINYFFIDRAYIIDHGYKRWMRISYNSFQMTEMKENLKWRKGIRIRPEKWQKKNPNGYILIVPPCNKAGKYWKFDSEEWLSNTVSEIRKHSDRDILIRSRPPVTDRYTSNSLVSAAAKAHIVVAYNSNAATEAIFAGTPALVLGEAASKFVAITDISQIENPIRPDRTEWIKNLMSNQFTREEIKNGKALKALMKIHNLQ